MSLTCTVVAVLSLADTRLSATGVTRSTAALGACSLHTLGSPDLPVGYGPIALRCNGSCAPDQPASKRDLCKQARLEVGAAKWGRSAEVSGFSESLRLRWWRGYNCTVAFSVAFILTLRWKVMSVLVTRFDNICNNLTKTHSAIDGHQVTTQPIP